MKRGFVKLKLSKEEVRNARIEDASPKKAEVAVKYDISCDDFSRAETGFEEKEAKFEDLKIKIENDYKKKYEQKVQDLESKLKELSIESERFNALLDSMQNQFSSFVKSKYWERESIVISLVVEALAKILGSNNINEKYIKTVVNDLLKKYSEGDSFRIKVSSQVFKFIEKIVDDKKFLNNYFHEDSRLNEGQLVFENQTSIREIGLIDRFDAIRSALIDELQRNDRVTEL